jgi:hypothetical protein
MRFKLVRNRRQPALRRGDKVTVVTKNLFMRGQLNRKLRDRQLGPLQSRRELGQTITF